MNASYVQKNCMHMLCHHSRRNESVPRLDTGAFQRFYDCFRSDITENFVFSRIETNPWWPLKKLKESNLSR